MAKMTVRVDEENGLELEHIYSGIALKADDGKLGICARDGSFEINIMPNGCDPARRNWWTVNMDKGTIVPDIQPKAVLLSSCDWEALYLDGVAVEQDHEIGRDVLLHWVHERNFDIPDMQWIDIDPVDDEDAKDCGAFPDTLAELKGDYPFNKEVKGTGQDSTDDSTPAQVTGRIPSTGGDVNLVEPAR